MAHELSPSEIASLVLEAIRNPKARERICKRHHIAETAFDKWQTKFIRSGTKALKPEASKRGRTYTREEKLNILFAGLRHDENRDHIFSEHHVSSKMYKRWHDEFVGGGKHVFERGLPRPNAIVTLVIVTSLLIMGVGLFIVMSTSGASCLYDVRAGSDKENEIKKIDLKTMKIYTAPSADWRRARNPHTNTYRNPLTHDWTLVDIQICPACGNEIPVPVITKTVRREDSAAVEEIIKKQVCPRCHEKIGEQLTQTAKTSR